MKQKREMKRRKFHRKDKIGVWGGGVEEGSYELSKLAVKFTALRRFLDRIYLDSFENSERQLCRIRTTFGHVRSIYQTLTLTQVEPQAVQKRCDFQKLEKTPKLSGHLSKQINSSCLFSLSRHELLICFKKSNSN